MRTLVNILEGILGNDLDNTINNSVKNTEFIKFCDNLLKIGTDVSPAETQQGKPFDFEKLLKDTQWNYTVVSIDAAIDGVNSGDCVIAFGQRKTGKILEVLVYAGKGDIRFQISPDGTWQWLYGRDGMNRPYIQDFKKYKWIKYFMA